MCCRATCEAGVTTSTRRQRRTGFWRRKAAVEHIIERSMGQAWIYFRITQVSLVGFPGEGYATHDKTGSGSLDGYRPREPLPYLGPGDVLLEPYKVGTFEIDGAPTVGVVLRDSLIVDVAAANTALEINPMYPHVDPPEDMLELIGQYEYGLKYRIYEIVNHVVGNDQLDADYVHRVEDVTTLAPILYPSKIMNAAVNFYSHACEGCTTEELAAQTRERREKRGVPYLFLKPTRGAVIGSGQDVVMPWGP